MALDTVHTSVKTRLKLTPASSRYVSLSGTALYLVFTTSFRLFTLTDCYQYCWKVQPPQTSAENSYNFLMIVV